MREQISKLIFEHFSGALIIVSYIDTNPDLSIAHVFIRTEDNASETIKELNRIAYVWRTLLFKKMTIKKMPKLVFKIDKAEDNEAKIEKILKQIKNG